MKPKHRRALGLAALVLSLSISVGLVLYAFRDNMIFFYSPTQVTETPPPPGKIIRIGGMVEKGSVHRKGAQMTFVVTDFKNTLTISYGGVVPDLFQEGTGVVAQGTLTTPTHLEAKTLLAKHDEKYMPPEVARTLSDQKP